MRSSNLTTAPVSGGHFRPRQLAFCGLFLASLASVTFCKFLPTQSDQLESKSSRRYFATPFDQVDSSGGFVSSSSRDAESSGYKCAKYCSCSMVKIMGPKGLFTSAELQQAKCEDPRFSDLLTLDRRTQIIHISLPQKQPTSSSIDDQAVFPTTGSGIGPNQDGRTADAFRMPRLVQFNTLREILVMNLKFEVCDSEVFKRGQRLRRLRLNHNQLSLITKSCFKHLDRLVELNLDHNQLEELESALFSNLLNLKSLSLAHNRLSDLAAHQFANLTQLVTLNLVGNSFKTINLHLLEPMSDSLRLLLLAKNQIKSFSYTIPTNSNNVQAPNSLNQTQTTVSKQAAVQLASVGLLFRNVIKLNVDYNKLERIKLIQLHRFFNVKFLSIRGNQIASIRDKAFNGLKLMELNLAHNELQSISKCAFCNSTIKRLVLAHNKISLSLPTQAQLTASNIEPAPKSAPQTPDERLLKRREANSQLAELMERPATGSKSLLIISHSIFGPLFNQLEYLDLSSNEQLADQLDSVLEPLLQLEYLNLASTGLDRSLPSPQMFKNQQKLRYLNLSHNQLDQVLAETFESLVQLEVLDLSNNKFNELDEALLVTLEELASLKLISFASNPWHCSQCKVAPLYDWIQRSQLYNQSCIAPKSLLANQRDADEEQTEAPDRRRQLRIDQTLNNQYDLLNDDKTVRLDMASLDFDQIGIDKLDPEASNYNLFSVGTSTGSSPKATAQMLALARDFATVEDDTSVDETLAQMSQLSTSNYVFEPANFCLRCEFPAELRAYDIHELSSGDFRFCAGSAPRFAASEPKIGLTLAIVIIGALFLLIVIVIVMYRNKSNNTYYPNDDTEHLDSQGVSGKESAGATNKPVFSISSSVDQAYDATDYSSPPMSHSLESYSSEAANDVEDEDEEDVEENDEDLDEEDEEVDEEDEEEESDNEDEHDDEPPSDNKGTGNANRAPTNDSSHRDIEKEPEVKQANQRHKSTPDESSQNARDHSGRVDQAEEGKLNLQEAHQEVHFKPSTHNELGGSWLHQDLGQPTMHRDTRLNERRRPSREAEQPESLSDDRGQQSSFRVSNLKQAQSQGSRSVTGHTVGLSINQTMQPNSVTRNGRTNSRRTGIHSALSDESQLMLNPIRLPSSLSVGHRELPGVSNKVKLGNEVERRTKQSSSSTNNIQEKHQVDATTATATDASAQVETPPVRQNWRQESHRSRMLANLSGSMRSRGYESNDNSEVEQPIKKQTEQLPHAKSLWLSGDGFQVGQCQSSQTQDEKENLGQNDNPSGANRVLSNVSGIDMARTAKTNEDSDSTTANSSVMEQMGGYLGAVDDDLESSGDFGDRLLPLSSPALEATNSCDEDDCESQEAFDRLADSRVGLNRPQMGQPDGSRASSTRRQFHLQARQQAATMRASASNHSALTQTGSQELDT